MQNDNKTNTTKITPESQNTDIVKPVIQNPVAMVESGEMQLHDVIAPNDVEVDFDFVKVNNVYYRTLFVAGYPRFVAPGWLEPVVNFNSSLDISFYVYPVQGKSVLDDLRRKIAEMEAEISTDIERGRIVDPSTTAKLEDARALQEQLVKGIERYYEFSFYITIPANSVDELNNISRQIDSLLGSLLIIAKHAMLDQREGFLSSPYGQDRLSITRNMDTTSVATTFPFTSAELSSDRGVLYGINSQNESFIIFDRFSLENGNMTVFATSGAGKSTNFSCPILYQDQKGNTKHGKIGEMIEEIIKKGKLEQIEKDIEGVYNPNIKVFAFDKNLKGKWSDVTIAARKVSPKYLYKMETRSGRKVTITKDHCLVCLKDGNVVTTKGDIVQIGNYLPVPRQVKQSEIRFDNAYSEELLTLLGLFTSEGHIGKRVSISNTDNKILELIARASKYLCLDISPIYNYPSKTQVRGYYFKNKGLLRLIKDIAGDGKSGTKRVPFPIFSLSDKQISIYLKAYFEGDGGAESHEITATTKSENLASDLAYLLLRFGIIARIHSKIKSATNTVAKIKREYYQISISGQDNIRKYIDEIGFITKEKNDKALKLLKKSNTNFDVVPELQSIFKEIYDELYNSEIPAPKNFSEVKLGIFKPSREKLLKIISGIKNRIYEIEKWFTTQLVETLDSKGYQDIHEHYFKINQNLFGRDDFLFKPYDIVSSDSSNSIRVIALEHEGNPYFLNEFSSGQISGLLFWEIVRSFWELHKKGVPQDKFYKGIVLIDEIDIHLHTKFQEVLPYLLGLFPQIQFIITTHSPMFLASMEKARYLEGDYVFEEGFDVYELPDGRRIKNLKKEYCEFEELVDSIKLNYELGKINREIIKSTKSLILLVEGESDKIILENAFKKLDFQKAKEIEIIAVTGASTIEAFFSQRDWTNGINNKRIIGIFDFDEAFFHWNRMKEKWLEKLDFIKIHTSQKGYVFLLPVPEFRKSYASRELGDKSILYIELLFKDEKLKEYDNLKEENVAGIDFPRKVFGGNKINFAQRTNSFSKEDYFEFNKIIKIVERIIFNKSC